VTLVLQQQESVKGHNPAVSNYATRSVSSNKTPAPPVFWEPVTDDDCSCRHILGEMAPAITYHTIGIRPARMLLQLVNHIASRVQHMRGHQGMENRGSNGIRHLSTNDSIYLSRRHDLVV
jgi:hypothetical protein